MVGTLLLSPVSAQHCPAPPLSSPTTVLCHHCLITVPSDCHLIPPPSHPSSCPITPMPPQSDTAITSSHRCHPYPTLPPPCPVTVPPYTAMASTTLPTPSCLVTVLSHHRPSPPPSCPATIVSHHCPTPPKSHPTSTVPFCHQPSHCSHPFSPCSLPRPSVSCRGGATETTPMLPTHLGPPPCATRLCHTGSCYPCPLRVPPQHHHPPPCLLGVGTACSMSPQS